MKSINSINLNLDCQNLLAYPASEKLYKLLVQYPQEIIPILDYTATHVFTNSLNENEMSSEVIIRVSFIYF